MITIAIDPMFPRHNCERSELSGEFNGTDFLSLYTVYIFQAVHRAVNVLNVSTCI